MNSLPRYSASTGGSPAVMPQFQYQQVQDPQLQRHNQMGIPATQFANAHSFHSNAQTSNPTLPSNGVLNSSFPGYGAALISSLPPPPFPPVPMPPYGTFPQSTPLLHNFVAGKGPAPPPSSLPQKPAPSPLPIKPLSSGSATPTNAVANTSDLEDGELSDGDLGKQNKETNGGYKSSPRPTVRKVNEDRQQFRRNPSGKTNNGYRSPNGNFSRQSPRYQARPKHLGHNPGQSPSTELLMPTDQAVDRRGHVQDMQDYPIGGNKLGSNGPSSGARYSPKTYSDNRQNSTASEVRQQHPLASESQPTLEVRSNASPFTGDRNPLANGYSRSDVEIVRNIRDRAKIALQDLYPHNIRYTNLVHEGLDSDLLLALYDEMGIKISSPILAHRKLDSAESHNTASVASKASVKGEGLSKPDSLQLHRATPVAAMASTVDRNVVAQNHIVPAGQELTIEQKRHELSSEGSASGKALRSSQASDVRLSTPSPEAKNNRRPTLPRKVSLPNEAQGNNTKSAISAPSMTETGVDAALPSVSVKALPKSFPSNPAVAKPADKAMERKDYIARMLAAKAGKPIPLSNALAPLVSSVIHEAKTTSQPPQSIDPQTTSAPKVSVQPGCKSELISTTVETVAPVITPLTYEDSQDNPGEHNASVEAKRKAQTDLARQKMEALKSRTASQRQTPVPTSVAPLAVRSQLLPEIHPPRVVDENLTLGATVNKPSQITPHGSYFSPSNERQPFNIPGLFVAPHRPSSITNSEQLMMISPTTHQQSPQTTTSIPSTHMTVHSQALLTQPTADSLSNEEPSLGFTTEALIKPSKSVSKVNEPRKRQKASDFINSPPTRVKRTLGQKEDISVIIDVSEDEANDDLEDEVDGMDIEQESNASFNSSQLQHDNSGIVRQRAIRDLPPLTDFPSRKKISDNPALMTPPAVQNPGKLKEPEDLKRREKEIELMKRRIAELEQRNKAKQTSSRAQTPGTPGRARLSPRPVETTVGEYEQSTPSVEMNLLAESHREQTQTKAQAVILPAPDTMRKAIDQEQPMEQQGKECDLDTLASKILQTVKDDMLEEDQQGQPPDHRLVASESTKIDSDGSHAAQATTSEKQQQSQLVEQQAKGKAEFHVETNRLQAVEVAASEKEQRRSIAEQHVKALVLPDPEAERSQSIEMETVEEEQRRRRRAEIESGLPVLDAEVERTRQRLQLLRKQMEDLESEVQKGLEGRRGLMDELVSLSPAPSPAPKASTRERQGSADMPVHQAQRGTIQGK